MIKENQNTMAKNNMNPAVDDYLNKAKKWQAEMKRLRVILLGCQLTEELKWKKPCYTFQGKNIVIIQGFKEYCALLFLKALCCPMPKAFLSKPEKIHKRAARSGLPIYRKSIVWSPSLKSIFMKP